MSKQTFQAFQVPGKGWNVKTTDQHGTTLYLVIGGPYTMAQAEMAADNLRREASRFGREAALGRMLICH